MERMTNEGEIARKIASKLIERFENSKAYSGEEGRMISITPIRDKALFSLYEDPKTHDLFVAASTLLANLDICTQINGKVDKKLIQGFSMNPNDDKSIQAAYQLLGRQPKRQLATQLAERISSSLEKLGNNSDSIRLFLEETRCSAIDGKIPKPFDGSDADGNILKVLSFLSAEHAPITERILSRNLFGDSKVFEKHVKASIVSILRKLTDEKGVSPEELLASFGIVRYPEEFSFSGKVCFSFKDGSTTDFSSLRDSITITSEEADRLEYVYSDSGIRTVTTVENKANYFYFVRNKADDELVVFLSGFQSPAKTRFLSIIHNSFPDATFRHTGDFEIGGFDIFVQLQKAMPSVVPYLMDKETLENNIDKAIKISEGSYLKRLEAMRSDARYAVFADVIDLMVEKKIRLEQEALIS